MLVAEAAKLDSRKREETEHGQAWEIVAMTYPKPTVRTVSGNGAFVLGRGSTTNVQLQDASVSREHARLTFGGPVALVEDLGSANGTRIVTVEQDGPHGAPRTADVPLAPHRPVKLPENATLHLGSVVVLVRRAWRPSEGLPTGLVAKSALMEDVVRMLDRVAPSPLHVVLVGPPGVGRDTLARALHERSRRASGPFVSTQASSRPAAVMERELFGIERDDQRSALPPKAGLLEAAHRGTLMIDSIGSLAAPLQSELLRALSGQQVKRVGSRKATALDVRLIVGTTQEDSFCRSLAQLGGVTLDVPALALRPDDVEALAEAFVARAAYALGRPAPEISREARVILLEYAWPQNVRELAEIMTRAVPLAGDGAILPGHLLLLSEHGSRELADESEITVMHRLPRLPL